MKEAICNSTPQETWKTLYSKVRSCDASISMSPTDNGRSGFTLFTDHPVCYAPTSKGMRAAINELEEH